MDVEDFDEDLSGLTPAQLIARERAAFGGAGLNSDLRHAAAKPRSFSKRPTDDTDFKIPAAGNCVGAHTCGLPGGDTCAREVDCPIVCLLCKRAGNTAGRGAFGLDADVADDLAGKDRAFKQQFAPLPAPPTRQLGKLDPVGVTNDLQRLDLGDRQQRVSVRSCVHGRLSVVGERQYKT